MKNLKYILFTTVFLFSIISVYAAEHETLYINSLELHIRITELTKSEEPFIVGENIVFTYLPTKSKVRHVGISFEHENFSKIYNLYRNENGVYFYIYEFPKREIINYKFIEEGIWINDKNNKSSKVDRNFISLSSFKIPENNVKEHITPIIDKNRVTFKIRAQENTSIYLTGDFNNWNPFLYRLNEDSPGLYSLTLNIPKGKYGYYYIYNGEKILDFENPLKGRSRIGEEVSLFTVQ